MKISKMAQAIEPSLTRHLFNMAKEYDDVIDLTLGDPDLQPNFLIKQAACDAIINGRTRYSANAGLPELRQKIRFCIEKEYGIQTDASKNIIVTVGGMEALFLSFATLLDPGDEVILQAPYYINYVQMIKMCGAIPVILETTEASNFQFTAKQLSAVITDKTVAIVLNSPGNPSGTLLRADLLDQIAAISIEKELIVISDEVYRTMIYDNIQHESILTRPGMQERTILIDSISKRFSMTGYRVGFAAAPQEIIANMIKMQENVCACAPVPSQYAAIEAYSFCLNHRDICQVFEKRRNCFVEMINAIPKIRCRRPEGTFYLFADISETEMNCLDFSYKLLEEEHVAVVPAIAYGERYTGYIRIAFTLEIDALTEAAKRISHFMDIL